MFEREVYPVLLRDCAYSQCHGAPQRFFRVFGPGRTRLMVDSTVDILAQERRVSYERARAMLITDGSQSVYASPLLVKPLEASLGGASHGGRDAFGRNVYRTALDPGFQTLVRWAESSSVPIVPGTSAAGSTTAGAGGTGIGGAGPDFGGVVQLTGGNGGTDPAGSTSTAALSPAATSGAAGMPTTQARGSAGQASASPAGSAP